MKAMKKAIHYIIAMAACAAVLAGCKKEEEIVGTNDGAGFFLNRTILALNKGTSEKLVATVTPKDAAQVTWSSENTAVATVEDGLVTAVGAGETVILAKSESNILECKVAVTSLVVTVTLDKTAAELWYGDELQLTATPGPEDINVPLTTTWSSSDEAVVTVSQEGLVKAVGGGDATVVVAINGVSATCDIHVRRNAEGIAITPASAEVNANHTFQFTASLLPADVTEPLDFEWSVEDESIATIDADGLLNAIAPGETKVIVKAGDFVAEAALTVKREIKTLSINPNMNTTVEEVTISFGPQCYYYGGRYGMEIPANGRYFTVSVPAGYHLLEIKFTPTYNGTRGDFTPSTGTYVRDGGNHSWKPTEDTESVTFTNNNGFEFDILTWTVTYE